ncbi:hypothetical protein NL676_024143 [Syzygium grande]|nr:hypothetical protein NL676_024143 [Syzygium grande]
MKLARGYELQPGELVGQASQTKWVMIWDCLMNEEVLCVGVLGWAGVGKSFLAKHIHDQIARDCPRFDSACLITVSREGTIGTMQTNIANYLELDLTGVSAVYWGARLKEALQGRKLLILDNVGKSYSLEEMCIALERSGCKLIVTMIEGGVRANGLSRACPCTNSYRGDPSWIGRSVKTRIGGVRHVGRGMVGV